MGVTRRDQDNQAMSGSGTEKQNKIYQDLLQPGQQYINNVFLVISW